MTSDDLESAGETEPPIWIPFDDGTDAGAYRSAEPKSARRSAAWSARLPTPGLAGGAAIVLLASAVVVGIIASRGPASSPDTTSRVAAPQTTATPSSSAKPSPTPIAVPTVTCTYPRKPGAVVPRLVNLPRATGVVKSGRAGVHIATNRGQITVSLDRAGTPCTVNNFLELAQQGFFDDGPCHRVTTKVLYVLQCGDPGGTGTGGPGYSFADENLPKVRTAAVTYPAGTVAMVNSGPNTNGSQFFIVYRATQLLPTWTIFGKVTTGLDVVASIGAEGTRRGYDGRPRKPVIITSVTPL